MRELKGYSMSGELAENRLRGSAAVMGNMDRQSDVIMPGAFRRALPEFLRSGFVAASHDWTMAQVVAMPVAAREQGGRLLVEAEFHSDEASQAMRLKCAERLAAGLSVGLSVGFSIADGGVAEYPNGKDLLKAAEAAGVDMSLLDVDAIKRRTNWCRAITDVAELYEFSVVPAPANPASTMTSVKGGAPALPTTEREFEQFLRDAGWSRSAATAIASHGFTRALRRDAGGGEADNDVGLRAARIALAQFRVSIIGGNY